MAEVIKSSPGEWDTLVLVVWFAITLGWCSHLGVVDKSLPSARSGLSSRMVCCCVSWAITCPDMLQFLGNDLYHLTSGENHMCLSYMWARRWFHGSHFDVVCLHRNASAPTFRGVSLPSAQHGLTSQSLICSSSWFLFAVPLKFQVLCFLTQF